MERKKAYFIPYHATVILWIYCGLRSGEGKENKTINISKYQYKEAVCLREITRARNTIEPSPCLK
jgi:hypothetical protein